MFGLNDWMSYYVCQRYVNMGLGINGLYKIVSQEMGEPPLGGGVFIFFGKSRQIRIQLMLSIGSFPMASTKRQ